MGGDSSPFEVPTFRSTSITSDMQSHGKVSTLRIIGPSGFNSVFCRLLLDLQFPPGLLPHDFHNRQFSNKVNVT